MPRSLVDTNVLVYAEDGREPEKRAKAIALIESLSAVGDFVLSVQCLNEFSSVAFRRGLPVAEVQDILATWTALSEVLPLTHEATNAALAAVDTHGLSFWDALIWATAHTAGVPVLFSEDFQHGRELEGVRFVNPFI